MSVLSARAAEVLICDEELAANWKSLAQAAASAGEFVNYRRSFDRACEMDEVPDGLSDLIEQ